MPAPTVTPPFGLDSTKPSSRLPRPLLASDVRHGNMPQLAPTLSVKLACAWFATMSPCAPFTTFAHMYTVTESPAGRFVTFVQLTGPLNPATNEPSGVERVPPDPPPLKVASYEFAPL